MKWRKHKNSNYNYNFKKKKKEEEKVKKKRVKKGNSSYPCCFDFSIRFITQFNHT